METKWAEENLQTIRTLMERSAVYRRALAPIMIFCGAIGLLAGVVGWLSELDGVHFDGRGFVLYWAGMATVALIGSFALVRRQALKDTEPFWSPPTRRVAQAMLPPLAIGLVLALFAARFDLDEFNPALIICWTWLYGCALHAAGSFTPRGIRMLGWVFIVAGLTLILLLLLPSNWEKAWPWGMKHSHLLMGVIFGGLHLVYGIYLYFTESRKTVA